MNTVGLWVNLICRRSARLAGRPVCLYIGISGPACLASPVFSDKRLAGRLDAISSKPRNHSDVFHLWVGVTHVLVYTPFLGRLWRRSFKMNAISGDNPPPSPHTPPPTPPPSPLSDGLVIKVCWRSFGEILVLSYFELQKKQKTKNETTQH